MAQQHFSTLLAVSYYLHAFLIPRILCIHIASMWQALPCSEALPTKHPAPSFLSQACSGHNELAAASSAHSQLLYQREKVHACYMIQFPVCVASILTILWFIDVFNVFLFGSDSWRQKWRSMDVQPNIKNTPLRVFLPAFLNQRRRHFAEAVGAPTSEESAWGCLSSGLRVPFSDFHRPRWASFLNILKSAEPQTHPWKC